MRIFPRNLFTFGVIKKIGGTVNERKSYVKYLISCYFFCVRQTSSSGRCCYSADTHQISHILMVKKSSIVSQSSPNHSKHMGLAHFSVLRGRESKNQIKPRFCLPMCGQSKRLIKSRPRFEETTKSPETFEITQLCVSPSHHN